jgi:hypothetical protein
MLYSFVPYARDIIKGKVRPARSTRLMFVLLLLVSLLQQHTLGSGWLLAMTVGDGVGAVAILLLAFKKGVGGVGRVDLMCYALLVIDITVWLSTGDALLALYLSILADLAAATPMLYKTWRQPWTETAFFFSLGVVGPILNIISAESYSYALILFPAYIALINLFTALLIVYRQHVVPSPYKYLQTDRQPLS